MGGLNGKPLVTDGAVHAMKILVVDDKPMMRDGVGTALQRAGYQVVAAPDGKAALVLFAKHQPTAVVTDLKMPEMDGLELLGHLRELDEQLPVVLMTAYGTVDVAVMAMKHGAFDFVQKPFDGDELIMTVQRAIEHRRLLNENAALRCGRSDVEPGPVMIGQTEAMRQLQRQIDQIADSQGTVMISGESGTGKEVVARTVHALSPRRSGIMLCVNCAALSSSLLESELFGHEKGAFTGAEKLRKGRFELADGGTLLLDEVSEVSPELQAKLLRVLQERAFERVGSSTTMRVDVRVIATTNRDLTEAVADGSFREDLYYRLNVLPVSVPPLRRRIDDLPALTEHFLDQAARREGRGAKRFDREALDHLMQYHWPGNVRELQNICERANVLAPGDTIEAGLVQPWLIRSDRASSPQAETAPALTKLEDVERDQIVRALGHFNGNRQRTATALGIGVRTLGLKLKKWKEQNLVAQTI